MLKQSFLVISVGMLLVLAAPRASLATQTIFSDDFDSEGLGWSRKALTSWNVVSGTVDVIGDRPEWCDLLPGNGRYLDLDGSSSTPGTIVSKPSFSLVPGSTYALRYELAGNQAPGSGYSLMDVVNVTVFGPDGAIAEAVHIVPYNDPFVGYTLCFSVPLPIDIQIAFQHVEGAPGYKSDNMGPLLDDVEIISNPAPGAVLLGAIGTGFVGLLRRRRAL